jgi:D-3-phosphoglycerate dehydrogenase
MIEIAVTSPSFSGNLVLRRELELYFEKIKYNETGKNLSPDSMLDFVGNAQGLILGLEKAGEELFRQKKSLKVIAKYGVGLNNIDLIAAKAAGVLVSYTPGVNKRSVSELVLAFMIGMSRNVFNSLSAVKNGLWIKDGGTEITGKKIGIIGFGNVGRDLASLLKPFGVEIYANDIISFTEETLSYSVKSVDLNCLLSTCDIVTLHVPYAKDTHHLIAASEFNLMKDGAIIINTSRGGVVDEEALLLALTDKNMKAALDVFEVEPQLGTALIKHPHIFPTPHIGGNSKEAVMTMGRAAIENLRQGFGIQKL